MKPAISENLEKELEFPIFLYRKFIDHHGCEGYAGLGLGLVDKEKAEEIRMNAMLDAARKLGIPIESE